MKLVVLTGGIASGKSAVCATLAEMGVPVIDADLVARAVVAPGEPAYREILEAFGPEVVAKDGGDAAPLDREKLGRIVFADPERRALLERITHPRIGARMGEEAAGHAAAGAEAIVFDIPLYLENLTGKKGAAVPADAVIVVHVDSETQLRRLTERDALSRADALARIDAQMPLDEKARLADYVIDNTGSPEETARQTRDVWRRILQDEKKPAGRPTR